MALLGTTVLDPHVRLLNIRATRRDPGGQVDITAEYVFYVGAVPHLASYTMLNQSTENPGAIADLLHAGINDEILPYYE